MKIKEYLYAKYRNFAPISCFESPRADVLRGWNRWRWLTRQRQSGRLVDPTVQIWCKPPVDKRLRLGHGASLDRGVIIWISDTDETRGNINLGEGTYIGPYSYVGSCHNLNIGNHTLIGAHSYLITVHHRTDSKDHPIALQGFVGGDIKIGRNVWLGAHVVVLPGVTIGDRAVIGAGAVVTKDIPAGETWVGVPARQIRSEN